MFNSYYKDSLSSKSFLKDSYYSTVDVIFNFSYNALSLKNYLKDSSSYEISDNRLYIKLSYWSKSKTNLSLIPICPLIEDILVAILYANSKEFYYSKSYLCFNSITSDFKPSI